ncbi:MAG: hypothetical protein IJ876_07335 [Elusimicrobiaceae bacterium]|nr:hypothetical protein [Elusimicrobiaceae bacterium]
MKKFLFFIAVFMLCTTARAEVSPLPEAHFHFIYNTEAKPLIAPASTELILCKDRLCIEAAPLGVYGSQKMTCGGGTCTAVAYEFEPFAKLSVTFEDGKTRDSAVFVMPGNLINPFNVYVDEDTLTLEPVDTPPQEDLWKRPEAWGALSLILVLELLCAAGWLLYTKKRFTILYGVAIANVFTAALTWGILVHYVAQSAIWWILCVILETVLIRLINYKDISLKDSAVLSIMTNVTSYTLGMILSFIWAQM